MGNDNRLDQLKAELEALTEQAKREIPLFVQQWEVTLAEQRGRIAEREEMLKEQSEVLTALENAPQSHASAPLSVLQGMQGAIDDERQKEA